MLADLQPDAGLGADGLGVEIVELDLVAVIERDVAEQHVAVLARQVMLDRQAGQRLD